MFDQPNDNVHGVDVLRMSALRYFAAAAILIATIAGCSRQQPGATPAPQQRPAFVADSGVLFRQDAQARTALLALDSATAPRGAAVVPAQWAAAAGSVFSVSAKKFRHVAASPQADRVAWETEGVHDLLGIVPAAGGKITVLDFFFDSSARELSWAPGGRYLGALYTPPSGSTEFRVYDTQLAKRLVTPWSLDCRADNRCEVVSAHWTGPSTVAVKTTLREYQTDVSKL